MGNRILQSIFIVTPVETTQHRSRLQVQRVFCMARSLSAVWKHRGRILSHVSGRPSMFVNEEKAVEQVKKSVTPEIVKFWPADVREGMSQMLREKTFQHVLECIVNGSVDRKQNKLGGATKKQAACVIEKLLEETLTLKAQMLLSFPVNA